MAKKYVGTFGSNLKSSMERFIVFRCAGVCTVRKNLKSSMERFIADATAINHITDDNLKSSMERFIDGKNSNKNSITVI